jgi:hypothetical protein
MRSEAVSTLRSWAKDRLGEQEDQLRSIERGVARLAELEAERHDTLAALSSSVARLSELGLDETRVAEFVGTDITRLLAGQSQAARSGRRNTPPTSTAITPPTSTAGAMS